MRTIACCLLLLLACDENPMQDPDSGGSADARPDALPLDATANDAAAIDASDEDSGEPEDADVEEDAGPEDTGPEDAGPIPCAQLQRDVCLATVGCVLDGSETRDPGYFCRDALTTCEQIKDPNACGTNTTCVYVPGECYCAE